MSNLGQLVTVFIVGIVAAPATHALNAKDYDTDGNQIISPAEQAVFAKDKHSPPLTRTDLNNNSTLEPNELVVANLALVEAASDAQDDVDVFTIDYPDGQPIGDFARENNTEDKNTLSTKMSFESWPIKLRATHEDITHGKSAMDPRKASPADLSFARDIKADNEILVLKGALMWPVDLNKSAELLGVPSVSINKVSNEKDKSKEIDSMVVRFGLDWERNGPGASTIYWRLIPTWTTDTSFNLDVRGVEFQSEPVGLLPGMGKARWVFSRNLGFRWRGILHGEYGRVEDGAGNANLTVGESFTRLGAKLETNLWLMSLESLALVLNYEYLDAVSGDLRDRKMFKAALSYDIDQDGHFKIQTKYTNGDASAALEDEESWTIGLGVKF